MSFFDKVNDFAKNVGDKASDAVETNRLNSKIGSEKNAIAEQYRRIGEKFFALCEEGSVSAEQMQEEIQKIKTHLATIEEAQAQIQKIKEETEQAQQAAAQMPTPEMAPVEAAPEASVAPVVPVAPEMAPAPEQTPVLEQPVAAARYCTSCGGKVDAGVRYCGTCGNRME